LTPVTLSASEAVRDVESARGVVVVFADSVVVPTSAQNSAFHYLYTHVVVVTTMQTVSR